MLRRLQGREGGARISGCGGYTPVLAWRFSLSLSLSFGTSAGRGEVFYLHKSRGEDALQEYVKYKSNKIKVPLSFYVYRHSGSWPPGPNPVTKPSPFPMRCDAMRCDTKEGGCEAHRLRIPAGSRLVLMGQWAGGIAPELGWKKQGMRTRDGGRQAGKKTGLQCLVQCLVRRAGCVIARRKQYAELEA